MDELTHYTVQGSNVFLAHYIPTWANPEKQLESRKSSQ